MLQHMLHRTGELIEGLVMYESQTSEHGVLLDSEELKELDHPAAILLTIESADASEPK